MGFIDEKRTVSDHPVKPRRMKGFPAAAHRARYCALVLAGFALIGFGYSRLGSSQNIIKAWNKNFPSHKQDEVDQNVMLRPVVGPMNSEGIQSLLEQQGIEFEEIFKQK